MSFSLGTATDTALLIITTVVYLVAGYKAYNSLRVLKESAYRSLAILTAAWCVLGVPYELNLARTDLGIGPPSFLISQFLVASFLAGAFVSFALIDRVIKASFVLDFFHRDVLLWQRGGRIVAWTVLSVLVFAFFLNYGQILPIAALFFSYPVIVLLVSTFRARSEAIGDYVRWFGVSILAIVIADVVASFIGYNFLQIFGAFFLYRAAGSLSGSTFHWEYSTLFNAPRDYVYSVYTNPEMLTKVREPYTSVRLEGRTVDGSEIVNVTAQAWGMTIPGKLIRKYTAPGTLEEEMITDAGGGTTRFNFVEENGCTRIHVSVDFEPKGPFAKFLGGLGARQVRNQFIRDFAIARTYCETNKPL